MFAGARSLVIVVAVAAGCVDRPVQATDGGSSTSTSGEPTSGPPTSGPPTSGGTTSTTAATDDSEATSSGGTSSGGTSGGGTSSGGTSGGTTSGEQTTEGGGTTQDGPSSTCGPPCARTWVHAGDLTVGPGDVLAEFECLTEIAGSLHISGSFGAALGAFASLQVVGGQFELKDDELITDLSAFACLRETDRIVLQGLPNLVDASGLTNVTRTPSLVVSQTGLTALPTFAADYQGLFELYLTDNPALVDLGPASTWPTWGGNLDLRISRCDALTSVAPVANLLATNFGLPRVRLDDLPALVSLQGLEPAVAGHLQLVRLPSITDLSPLANFASVDPEFALLWLAGMPQVTSLQDLGAIEALGYLIVGGCPEGPEGPGMDGLTSLAGLDSLASVQVLLLGNNANLTSLAGTEALTTVAAELKAAGNPKLPQAAFADLLAQVNPASSCFGDWGSCSCQIDLLP